MTRYCPQCDQQAELHEDKPWLGAVCSKCGTTIETDNGL